MTCGPRRQERAPRVGRRLLHYQLQLWGNENPGAVLIEGTVSIHKGSEVAGLLRLQKQTDGGIQ